MKITGKLNVIGSLEDVGDFSGAPGIELVRDDDSPVVVVGLTEEECRKLAPFFGDRITITVEGA